MVAYREDPVDSRGVIAHVDCNGVPADIIDDPFGRQRCGLPNGSTGHHDTRADVSEHVRSGEDEGPIFGGGDEDSLYDLGDADGLLGGASGLGTGGGVDRERQSPVGTGLVYFFDDDRRWGKRRPDECDLNFLDGNDCVSWLGDGEDLP